MQLYAQNGPPDVDYQRTDWSVAASFAAIKSILSTAVSAAFADTYQFIGAWFCNFLGLMILLLASSLFLPLVQSYQYLL